MENLEDIELVRLAKEGDSVAFENLVERNYMLVYKISYKWCGIKEDAEDIAQDVFVKLARKIQSFKETSTFQTWLYRMTINSAKDFAKKSDRKRKRETAYVEQQELKVDSNQNEVSLAEKLHQMIKQLPHKLRETALLVFGEGMNHKEAAVVLDCAEKTVSWRVFQVKKKLRRHLEREEVIW